LFSHLATLLNFGAQMATQQPTTVGNAAAPVDSVPLAKETAEKGKQKAVDGGEEVEEDSVDEDEHEDEPEEESIDDSKVMDEDETEGLASGDEELDVNDILEPSARRSRAARIDYSSKEAHAKADEGECFADDDEEE